MMAYMQARVHNAGGFSETFQVTNGVKQGCVMAPTLFTMMFSAMFMDAFQDRDTGFQKITLGEENHHHCNPTLRQPMLKAF